TKATQTSAQGARVAQRPRPPLPGLTSIDLCSGAGGVSQGMKQAGVRVLAAVDINPRALASYELNHPGTRTFCRDILELEPADLIGDLGMAPGALDILAACVPCQPYSSLRRHAPQPDDAPESLVDRAAEYAAVMRPRAVIMENVPSLSKQANFGRLVS